MRRGSAKRSMPVCEWHWAPTSALSRTLGCSRWGCGFATAPRRGAEVCGVGAELGTVEVGKLADLIVVAANPLDDITNVRRLQLVLKEGRVVSDNRI